MFTTYRAFQQSIPREEIERQKWARGREAGGAVPRHNDWMWTGLDVGLDAGLGLDGERKLGQGLSTNVAVSRARSVQDSKIR